MAHRSYDMVFKLKAIAAAEGGSKQAAAHKFKTDAKRVRKRMVLAKGETDGTCFKTATACLSNKLLS